MTAIFYKSYNNKSNNNEDKVCLLLRRWGLVDHVLDHVLDHMLDYMLRSYARSHDHKFYNYDIIVMPPEEPWVK